MQHECDNPGTLIKATHALLKKDKRDLLTIHKETGVPYYWLKKFAEGLGKGFKNPSVNRVQFLYEKLSSKELIKHKQIEINITVPPPHQITKEIAKDVIQAVNADTQIKIT